MIKVGLTGGIGSGKTTVCEIFNHLGIPVYNADQQAKHLISTNERLQTNIKSVFGNESFTDRGYNREYMAKVIFANKNKLAELNAIVHPAVAMDFEDWANKHKHHPYLIHEAAILVESGTHTLMDKVIVVDAPVELRTERVMKRDNISREQVMSRMQNQLPTDKIKAIADWTIDNDDKTLILPQVLTIHQQILISIS